jgi:hypothetical protein
VISRTTRNFWKNYHALREDVQRQAVRASAYSVRIGVHWRAPGYRETVLGEAVVTWFWIGSHADYDKLVVGL